MAKRKEAKVRKQREERRPLKRRMKEGLIPFQDYDTPEKPGKHRKKSWSKYNMSEGRYYSSGEEYVEECDCCDAG